MSFFDDLVRMDWITLSDDTRIYQLLVADMVVSSSNFESVIWDKVEELREALTESFKSYVDTTFLNPVHADLSEIRLSDIVVRCMLYRGQATKGFIGYGSKEVNEIAHELADDMYYVLSHLLFLRLIMADNRHETALQDWLREQKVAVAMAQRQACADHLAEKVVRSPDDTLLAPYVVMETRLVTDDRETMVALQYVTNSIPDKVKVEREEEDLDKWVQ